jgi:hypothetical protein
MEPVLKAIHFAIRIIALEFQLAVLVVPLPQLIFCPILEVSLGFELAIFMA